jgi:chloramphenicol-sensitive protein RarD
MSMSSSTAERTYKAGLIGAICAFLIWGFFPVYLKPLNHVSAVVLTAIRAVGSCVAALITLRLRGELHLVTSALTTAATRRRLLMTSCFIAVNWGVYTWGVAHGRVLETSLGYFINPLVNVVLGVMVLSERLNPIQWIAVGLAAFGVAYLTWATGQTPWIAISVALSFGFYGLFRKITPVAALPGLACEMLLLSPIAVGVLIFAQTHASMRLDPNLLSGTLLVLSGPLSALALALFTFGAQRIPYVTIGMLQYLAPTLQFLVAIWFYREPFAGPRVLGFALIWFGLLIYMIESAWRLRSFKERTATD